MKKGFHVFLFILFAVLMSQSAWAGNIYETVTKNGQVVEPPCSDDKIVTVASGVTSFLITYNQVANGYSMHTVYGHRCEGVLYVNAPSEKTLSFSGKVVLRQFNRIHIYDRSGTSERNMYSKDAHTQATSGEESFNSVYTKGSQASVVFSNDGELDYSNYVKLNVSVHDFHYASVSIPWEKDEPWHFYQIWEKTSFYWDPWEETTSGYYESNHIKFHVGRMIYMKNPGAVMDIWGINVKDAEGNLLTVRVLETGDTAKGNLYPGTSYLNRFLYFIMPESDVVVVPTYTRYLRYEQIPRGFGYNLGNESRSVRVDSSIHVYDDGGIDYKYANNFDGYLTVTAHKGHRIKVTGTVATEASYDYLEVFEGMKGASTTPICRVTSTSTNVAVAVPDKCKSADSVLTLHFHTDGSNFADGLNLVLSAEVLSYNVTINNNQTSYGTIRSDKTTAETGSKVTLTASPKSDYFLKSVSVVNTRTNETVTTSEISDNKVTFTMPAGNVKVTPTFAKETYTITQSTVTGGYLNVAYTAKVGTTVWITANPSSGYMLKDIVVKDASGNIVKLNKNDFKSFSFTMPLNNVMIIPSWTTDWSANGGVYVNMPTSGIANAIIPADVKSFKIYDDGGKDGEHSRSNSGTLVLTAPSGYILQLSGRMKSYSSDDYLFVCDGADTTKTKLVKKSYSDNIGVVYSSGQSATLYYYSFPDYDNAHDESALDLTVAVIPVVIPIMYVNASSGGSVTSSSPTQAARDSMVNFTYNYNSGYLVSEINVVAENDKTVKVDGGWYNNKTASFKMPATRNVTVTSTYTNNWSAEGGLYVNMPKTGIVNATIPTGVKSFKIYDDGGKDDLYSNNSNGTLVLTAPDGYVLQVTGSIMTGYESRTCKEYSDDYVSCKSYTYTCNAKDNLSVYDGSSTTAATMLSNKTSDCTTSDGPKNTSLRRLQSGGQSMTLVFKSYVLGYTSSGLDLTVTVIPVVNQITYLNASSGGSVTSSSPTQAARDSTVNFTYNYSSGYLVSEINVVAENGKTVKVDGGWYSNKTASFKMPLSNVTVTSTYTNNLTAGGLYINMPDSGTVNATIPEGVKSFKVYDDGGKDKNYGDACSGTLVLTAPNGYVLQLSGSVDTDNSYYSNDFLTVYDGEDNTKTKLVNQKHGSSSIGEVVSSGQSMTLYFASKGYENASGLDLTVELVPLDYTVTVANFFGGNLADVPKIAHVDDEISLKATSVKDYMLVSYVVKDADDQDVSVIRNTLTEGKFKMPASNVTITPIFADMHSKVVTADDGFHLDMTKNRKVEINLPSGVKSLKLYDNGGKDGDYANSSKDTLILTAPQNFYLVVNGSDTLESNYDSLYIFDGANTSATRWLGTTGSKRDIGTFTSTGRSLTFRFKSDNSVQKSGFRLTVSVEPVSKAISIVNRDGLHGGMTSDKSIASPGAKVTLTATPDKGYLIDGVEVKDANNNVVALNNDIYWYCNTNTVSFKMPSASVTVTPKFSPINALSVNMPKKGSVMRCDVNIPENITSFKIYDDGGETGNYSNNVAGEILVVFDKKSGNAGLKLSGSVAAKEGTTLDVYAWNEDTDGIDIFYNYHGSSDGRVEDIGTFINSSSLVLDFSTGKVGSGAGLDLRVDVVKSPGAGVEVVYDDAHVIGDGKLSRWASITDGDKTSELNIPEDVAVDTITLSRNFKTNNVYNTILFPFDVKADSLDGVVKVLRFNGFKQLEDKSWAVRMKRVWTMDSIGKDIDVSANYPYLVVMDENNLVVRGGVTLRKTVEPIAMAEDCNWKFIGTLSYQEWPEGNPLVYGFKDNQFVKAGANVSVKPLRAYLLKPEPKQASGRPSLNGSAYTYEYIAPIDNPDEIDIIEDDDENGENTTVIGRYNTRTGEFKMLPSYDIKGRKLNGKPNVHKAYYGKKVIRK